MHDVLRQRLIRKIEGLPEEQVYQVLDYIEFMESKYASKIDVETSGLRKFAEDLEDKLRRTGVSPGTIREAFQFVSSADKVLSDFSRAGRQILDDLQKVVDSDSRRAVEVVEEILNVEVDGHDSETSDTEGERKRSAGECAGEGVEGNEMSPK